MAVPLRLLIVEHSRQSADRVLCELRLGGYEPAHRRVETADEMLAALRQQSWDVVVAAYVLPAFSACAALELLQQHGYALPFVIISGDTGEDIAAATIRIADDHAATRTQYQGVLPAVSRLLREAAAPQPRLRPEDRIRMCDMHFRELVEHMAEVFWIADPTTGQMLYVSPGYEKIWCRSRDSLYGDGSSRYTPTTATASAPPPAGSPTPTTRNTASSVPTARYAGYTTAPLRHATSAARSPASSASPTTSPSASGPKRWPGTWRSTTR